MAQTFQKGMISTLAAVGTVALVAGCGSNEPGGRIVDGVAKEQVKVEMRTGTWTAGCQDSGPLAQLFDMPKAIEEISYGSSLQKNTIFYNDNECKVPAITVTENGDYDVASQVKDKIYQLNQKFNSVAITPNSEEGKDKLNAVLACTKSDWTVGQTKDVTVDSSSQNRCWTKTPREIFDIVEIRESNLRYGLADAVRDKTAADKRPEKLNDDASLIFKRK